METKERKKERREKNGKILKLEYEQGFIVCGENRCHCQRSSIMYTI